MPNITLFNEQTFLRSIEWLTIDGADLQTLPVQLQQQSKIDCF
jgi:hypothetical protein